MVWKEVLLVTVLSAIVEGIEVGSFTNRFHGIGGTLTFNDANTFTITGFTFDGQGLDVFLYSYAPGVNAFSVSRGGTTIPVQGSIGRGDGALAERPFNGETLVVTLPEGMDVCDIGTLTVWCDPFDAIFGFLEVSTDDVIESESPCTLVGGDVPVVDTSFNNCIRLHETLQLSWRVDDDNSQVRFRLCGCQSDGNTNQYMGFGLSGSDTQTLMFGADPTITWVDTTTGEPNAVDYHLSDYTQCRAGVGACPDTLDSSGTCTNDISQSDVSGFVSNGQQCVLFTRSFSTNDSTCDIPIDPTNENQYIVWGIGGLGETAFRHFTRAQSTDDPIHLGRTPVDECMGVDLVCTSCPPFMNERIVARNDSTFVAHIGPSGNERGYMAITGQAGWGIAWYINGNLIPELIVERNKTYTFLVQGGDTPDRLDVYHPFYITSSKVGGRLQNDADEQTEEVVYAGITSGNEPTAVGPLCEVRETQQATTSRQTCRDLNEYLPLLETVDPSQCDVSNAGILEWTPDETTPDIVYYQCATHLNLGWRILVINEGDPVPDSPIDPPPPPSTTEPPPSTTEPSPTTTEFSQTATEPSPTTTTTEPSPTTTEDDAKTLVGSLSLTVAVVAMVLTVFQY